MIKLFLSKVSRFVLVLSVVSVWGVCSGCSSASVKTQYFTLHADSSNKSSQTNRVAGGIGIGPVVLPGLLNRKEILTFTEGQQVRLSSHRYWAEDLKTLVSRVITENVSHTLSYQDVWAFPWSSRVRPQKNIEISITQFGGQLNGTVYLSAKWRLLDDFGKVVLDVGQIHLDEKTASKTYESYVFALNALLNQLSVEITKSVTNNI